MIVRSRRHLSPAAHWVTLLIGLAVLLDVLWIASRLQQPGRGSGLEVAAQVAAADADRAGPPSLHMHTIF